MNKNESRYQSTAILFDEALINLLEHKDIDYITIKEICDKAGVNRSTFYLHYENISDLINECMEYVNQKFLSKFEQAL
jgi:AcrR family transcriptional regulator